MFREYCNHLHAVPHHLLLVLVILPPPRRMMKMGAAVLVQQQERVSRGGKNVVFEFRSVASSSQGLKTDAKLSKDKEMFTRCKNFHVNHPLSLPTVTIDLV